MKIFWTEQARTDLESIQQYISEENPKSAPEVARTLIDSVERLMEFPASGRPGRKPDTRELVVAGTPYLLSYRVRNESLQILRVIHGARNWP